MTDRMMGVVFIKRANKVKYGKLLTAIRDQHSFNIDVYPKTLHGAYELLENHSLANQKKSNDDRDRDRGGRDRRGRGGRDGGRGGGRGSREYTGGRQGGRGREQVGAFQYAQTDEVITGTDGRTKPRITCFNCQKLGHFADMCPDIVTGEQMHQNAVEIDGEVERVLTEEVEEVSGGANEEFELCEDVGNHDTWADVFSDDSDDSLVTSLQYVSVAPTTSSGRYCDTDILIDTGSTTSVFNNPKMLLDIQKSNKTLRSYSNGGSQDSNWRGYLPGFFKVWLNVKSMLNILSFKEVRKRFRITVDTAVESTINVHIDELTVLKFEEVESGLYLLRKNNCTNKNVSAYSFLTLVRANKADFTTRQVKRADIAREFRKHLSYPGYKKYFKLLQSNYFRNCPITVDDAKRALHIYGPDVEDLNGKTVRGKPNILEKSVMVTIPDTIIELHPRVDLSADYFFVQGIGFLHSISGGYNFRTVEHLKDFKKKYTKKSMLNGIKKCINVYHTRGLTVDSVNSDNEFGCIRDDILPTNLNMVAADEHVGDVERSIRTVKEGTRCHVHRLPYERYTKLMVSGCVVKTIKDLNQLPSPNGLSDELSPSTLKLESK